MFSPIKIKTKINREQFNQLGSILGLDLGFYLIKTAK